MPKQTITTVEGFNKKLSAFSRAVKTSQNAARECSNFAILHFEKCGDLGPAQRFYDVLRKEGNRKFLKRDGYLVWLTTHAPILFDKNTLAKDMTNKAVKFNTAVATSIPYWMFSQDNDELIAFGGEDVWKEIHRVYKKYAGDKYAQSNDNTGDLAVSHVKNMITKHAPELLVTAA